MKGIGKLAHVLRLHTQISCVSHKVVTQLWQCYVIATAEVRPCVTYSRGKHISYSDATGTVGKCKSSSVLQTRSPSSVALHQRACLLARPPGAFPPAAAGLGRPCAQTGPLCRPPWPPPVPSCDSPRPPCAAPARITPSYVRSTP